MNQPLAYRLACVGQAAGRLTALTLPVVVVLAASLVPAAASGEELVYVKKDTRQATQVASLAASGVATLDVPWYLIGPFPGGQGVAATHPPEQEIDLSAKYPGAGQPAVWTKTDFVDGQAHDLKRFLKSDNCDCYLYRKIESQRRQSVRCSLGSDDGIKVWLNGRELLAKDNSRAVAADQEFVTLDLQPGRNDLLIKITNLGGDWAYYFQPEVPQRLLLKLTARLDADFPPGGEAGYYRKVTLPLPAGELIEGGGLAFRPDGRLYVATRRGDVWLVDNPLSDDPDEIRWRPYCRGLHEVLGLCVVGENDLLLVQRPEITRVRDTNGDGAADEFTTVCDKFGISGDYHEYLFGPARDRQGNLFVTLNVGFGGGHQSRVPYRGCCLKISPTGQLTPWAYGLRSPNGINFSPAGRLYYCDNQGEWVGACKLQEIRQGEFYGHAASVRWWPGGKDLAGAQTAEELPQTTPPAVWFPYSMSQSASEPVWDTTGGKFGPFVGQCFIGEQKSSLVMRAALEEVNGRMQGACFLFRKGFQCGVNRLVFAPDGSLLAAETNRGWGSVGGQPHGLERLLWTGRTPLEMLRLEITPEGWNVVFTKPVNREQAADLATYQLQSYAYRHWRKYGSPEIARRENQVTAASVSADGLTVRLTVHERKPGRVFHLRLKELTAADGDEFLPGHQEAWYTLNQLP